MRENKGSALDALHADTHVVTAWGETKDLHEWQFDPRCGCRRLETLRRRLRDGWKPEEALSRARYERV